MPKVPYPYEVNGKLVTGNGSLIPICSLSNCSLLPSLTVLNMYSIVLGMYLPPVGEAHAVNNRWVAHFTSAENRHALPLFTSLLNLVCSYDPAGILPYNHLIFQVRS